MELKSPRVGVGPASVLGWISSAAFVAYSVAEGLDTSHGWKAAVAGGITLLVTNTMRQLQAHGLDKAARDVGLAGAGVEAALPTLEQEIEQPPPVPQSAVQSVPGPLPQNTVPPPQ
jgi:hypothetical protein